VIAGIMVFTALRFLKKFEAYFYDLSRVMDLYVELASLQALKEYQTFVREQGIQIQSSQGIHLIEEA